MESLKAFIATNIKLIGVGACVAGSSVLIARRLSSKNKKKERICGVDYPVNTVIVHQFSKGDYAPSLGHFVVKLETFLRIAKIPYQKKIPWIEYNGVTMGDSQLIINFLNEKFNVNLKKGLSKEQRAVAWAIQKWIEEFTYHLNVYIRWYLLSDDIPSLLPSVPKAAADAIKARVKQREYTIGTGRHTSAEVYDMMVFDLRQLSLILGEKKFLMGEDEPTEVDCAVFGILSQVRWQTPDRCPGKQVLTDELKNLMTYLDRIKQLYWPDWDDRITDGK